MKTAYSWSPAESEFELTHSGPSVFGPQNSRERLLTSCDGVPNLEQLLLLKTGEQQQQQQLGFFTAMWGI